MQKESSLNSTITTAPVILLALCFLLLGNLFATGADVFVKLFSSSSGIYQYLFLRQLLIALCLFPFFINQVPASRKLERGKIQLVRANLTVVGGACVVIAVTELTLATANVLFYASPVITLLFAAWWFKETLHKHRILNLICCFVGVIVALRPDSAGLGVIAGLGAAICIACHNLLVRYIPKSTSSFSVMFWGTVLSLPLLALLSLTNWQPLTTEMFYLVAGSAICLFGYQMCCIVAYRKAEAGAIAIAEYSGLIFAALLGWWMFSESIEILTIAGIALIILPIVFQTIVEHQRARRADIERLRP